VENKFQKKRVKGEKKSLEPRKRIKKEMAHAR
jgi:hypothetical protein